MDDDTTGGATSTPMAAALTQYHVLMLQGSPRAMIDRGLVRSLQKQLAENVSTKPDQTLITLWLDTPGGDPHAAYKLYLELRGRCARFEVIIPDYAKSAGTLLVLGADAIHMGLSAELGPLDAQVGHPDREDMIVSALDVTASLEQLALIGVNITIAGGADVLMATGLSRAEVYKRMLNFSAQLLQPAVARLDPHILHRARAQLDVAKQYAKSMLASRGDGVQKVTEADAETLLQRLIEEYPEHGYVISRDEAKRLGLPVQMAEAHPRWGLVQSMHAKAVEERRNFVFVFSDAKLDESIDGEQEHPNQDGDHDARQKQVADEQPAGNDPGKSADAES